ncbi:DNA gyrase subunit B [Aminomonas paucivorans DSM 12260]|uniref:DNA gyrase subunit B n=1 Tax=Aminomonas paucivorans DSM 12260 TaxID=584708 RepID=E3CXP0_9BACT|nr:DNA topoisomerase (ATP-hydrolyzing) subunit B [Aminomonas paucivorans]EFQ22633.1 DNA gyrase subunit B [Aminomonas paucivorans DSM 12260]
MEAPASQYTAKDIQVLEGLEAVRKRPGMYIGDQGPRGLHHLVYEVVDNAIDEAMAGVCDTVYVTIHPEGSVSVVDNGRGIPTEIHAATGKSAAEVVLTVLHAGAKFDKKAYQVSGGLHGVGVSVVNALSEWLEVTIWRNGREHRQRFERGAAVTELQTGEDTDRRGTKVQFMPDEEIFSTLDFSSETLLGRLRELAFLNPGITIHFQDLRQDPILEKHYHFEGGIASFAEYLNRGKEVLFKPPVVVRGEKDNVVVDVALQYNDTYLERVFAFANLINTVEGGTHVSGFRTALTRAVNDQARKEKILKDKDPNFTGDDLKEGLTAVVSVKLLEPQFEGQTKTKLGNGDVKGIVDSVVYEGLKALLEERADILKPVVDKAVRARQAREAAKKARDLVRRKSAMSGLDLPGKLADCSNRNPEECEVYIVEGESAGGSAKMGRNRSFQAILPLRGKILNVERARLDKILSNEMVRTIIQALGCGVGDDFDYAKLRYHKIFLMADADVDGAHIRTLLLTLFFRYMPQIIENGHLYVAQPPLYRVQEGKTVHYCFSDKELKTLTDKASKRVSVQRYKGLGEMNPEQLWETTMDPANRIIKRVEVDDAVTADELFGILMGDAVEPRREFIETHAKEVRNLDI